MFCSWDCFVQYKILPQIIEKNLKNHYTYMDNMTMFVVRIFLVMWKDWKPIYFISSYHDPSKLGSVKRRTKDGTAVEIKIPQFVTDYNKYMGGCDTNDQIAKLNKTRRH